MRVLSEDTLITRVMGAVAAGSTDSNSASVNLGAAGNKFHSVMFVALIGTITATAVTGLKIQQSDDDGSSDSWGDVKDTAVVIADDDDDKAFYVEAVRPDKTWQRLVVTRGTANAVIVGAVAIQYNARKLPVTQAIGGTAKLDTIEGTP